MNAFVWIGLSTELGVLVYIAVYFGAYLKQNYNWDNATVALLVVFFMIWVLQLIFLVKKWQKK
ncbi:MAG: hypothetical protein HAW60_00045 [Bdellovibrionales bacterium]|nr:hypothetical protein [Bdellovibrionales bacterium]